jgi:hypothetical protein
VLDTFQRLLVDNTTASPSPPRLLLAHLRSTTPSPSTSGSGIEIVGGRTGGRGTVGVGGEGDGTGKEDWRQDGGIEGVCGNVLKGDWFKRGSGDRRIMKEGVDVEVDVSGDWCGVSRWMLLACGFVGMKRMNDGDLRQKYLVASHQG